MTPKARDSGRQQTNYKERDVKKYMILHYGFEKPTPEIMAAWGKWFESVADKQVDQGGFSGGREISDAGTTWAMVCTSRAQT